MQRRNADLKVRIQRHYDIAAPLYRDLWGIHIHHGYWQDGTETKEVAQEQLIELLAENAGIQRGARVLDIGCGFGGSAKYLAERFASCVVGISISRKQLEIAIEISNHCRPRPEYVLMDAEQLALTGRFDVLWSIEAISHLADKSECFRRGADLLAPRGRIAIIDWFKAEGLDSDEERRLIEPIVHRMLLPGLQTMRRYAEMLEALGCHVVKAWDLSSHVSKTWDICLGFARIPAVWRFALENGPEFVSFLQGFAAMRHGFRSRAFQCGMLIAEKTSVR